MPVVADVNANPGVAGLKTGIASVAGCEVKLLPKSRSYLRNMVLPVFPKVSSVGINNSRRIEIQTRHLLFVHGNNNHHLLLGAEIRPVKKFLKTQDLHFLLCSLLNQLEVLVDHRLLDLGHTVIRTKRIVGLNKATADASRHYLPRIK